MADGVIKFVTQTGSATGADLPSVESGEIGLLATDKGLVVFQQYDRWFLDKPTFVSTVGSVALSGDWQELTPEITIPSNIGTENGCYFRLECDVSGEDGGGEYYVGAVELQVLVVGGSQWGTWTIPYVPNTAFRTPIVLKFYANPGEEFVVRAKRSNGEDVTVSLTEPVLRRDYLLD